MKKRTQMPKGGRPFPFLGNERGMLLVMTMIILLVVSTLAAANLINAFLERSLAKNQNYASIALNAADAGINAGVAWVNDEANLATIPITGSWTRTGDPVTVSLASGGSYELTISFKKDTLDRDCDGDCVGDPAVIPPSPAPPTATRSSISPAPATIP